MQIHDIKTDDSGKELTHHGDDSFPCGCYDEVFSQFLGGEVPWHWHDEVEIVFVARGSTLLESVGSKVEVHTGEMVLINSGALHRFTDIGDEDCRILNAVFKPRIMSEDRTSLLHQKYLTPIIRNTSFSFCHFSPEVKWQGQAIETFKSAFDAWQSKATGFEMEMTIAVMRCWLALCQNQPDLLKRCDQHNASENRLHKVIGFIQQHYSDPILVDDLSAAANISASECYRLFKHLLHCTPNQYLLSYRLRKSVNLLLDTDTTITTIAHKCGFNCPAYFGKRFRQAYGKTPKQYRQSERSSAHSIQA